MKSILQTKFHQVLVCGEAMWRQISHKHQIKLINSLMSLIMVFAYG